jgi:UDP-N-acetylmuramate dehydrogenase
VSNPRTKRRGPVSNGGFVAKIAAFRYACGMDEPLFTAETAAAYLQPEYPDAALAAPASRAGEIRRLLERCLREHPVAADIRWNEPMAAHTTFHLGGPADCWVRPAGDGFPAFAAALLRDARAAAVPVFLLGGGANLLVADRGIRGIVLDTGAWAGSSQSGGCLVFRSGCSLDDAAETAAAAGLSGLEFLAGMPGSIGGAVWMNARCYGRDIAGSLCAVEIIDCAGGGEPLTLPVDRAAFGYKKSPFQNRNCLILSAAFNVTPGDTAAIRAEMESHRRDREAKGQYRFPSAGSAFKNNRAFGKPSGQIIDELGLRGLRLGGAQVAPFHGNILINAGGATAADIRALAAEVAARVQAAAGFSLEPEILFVGDW